MTASAPLISVLLPCYNAADHLPDCITSLEAQTLQQFEVIAVNDGSTDQTPELLRAWASRDPRVNLMNPGHVGLIKALQIASSVARGQFIGRMDADDIAHPDRLQRQLNFLAEHPRLAACGSQIQYFPSEVVREGARAYQDWLNSLIDPDDLNRNIFVECPIAHPALFIRADAFDQVGGYQEQNWPEDYDLILRLWSAGHQLANVPEVLLRWRERSERLSRTHPRYSLDAFTRCKAHYLTRTLVKNRKIVIWGAGPVGKSMARELIKQGAALRAFIDIDPRKIWQTVYEVKVLPPDRITELPGCFFVAAVGRAQARSEIRAALHSSGLRELVDFCAVA